MFLPLELRQLRRQSARATEAAGSDLQPRPRLSAGSQQPAVLGRLSGGGALAWTPGRRGCYNGGFLVDRAAWRRKQPGMVHFSCLAAEQWALAGFPSCLPHVLRSLQLQLVCETRRCCGTGAPGLGLPVYRGSVLCLALCHRGRGGSARGGFLPVRPRVQHHSTWSLSCSAKLLPPRGSGTGAESSLPPGACCSSGLFAGIHCLHLQTTASEAERGGVGNASERGTVGRGSCQGR